MSVEVTTFWPKSDGNITVLGNDMMEGLRCAKELRKTTGNGGVNALLLQASAICLPKCEPARKSFAEVWRRAV